MRVLMVAFDVTELNESELADLTGEVFVQAEDSTKNYGDAESGGGHPSVQVLGHKVERVGLAPDHLAHLLHGWETYP